MAHSALESAQGKRCTEYLSELSDENVRYNYTRTGPRGSYNVVEVPTYSENGKYVTVYTENGYSEINTETGYCNTKLNDSQRNRKTKLLEMFKQREDAATDLVKKLTTQKKAEPMAIAGLSVYQVAIDSMKQDCAADFPFIYDYLERNNKLPKVKPQLVDPVPPR